MSCGFFRTTSMYFKKKTDKELDFLIKSDNVCKLKSCNNDRGYKHAIKTQK